MPELRSLFDDTVAISATGSEATAPMSTVRVDLAARMRAAF